MRNVPLSSTKTISCYHYIVKDRPRTWINIFCKLFCLQTNWASMKGKTQHVMFPECLKIVSNPKTQINFASSSDSVPWVQCRCGLRDHKSRSVLVQRFLPDTKHKNHWPALPLRSGHFCSFQCHSVLRLLLDCYIPFQNAVSVHKMFLRLWRIMSICCKF